jgi:hypothetical protein
MTNEEVFKQVLDCSFKVHSALDPGLLESSYEECLFAQILTYLKLSGCRLGLLVNFNVRHLKDGIKRVIL